MENKGTFGISHVGQVRTFQNILRPEVTFVILDLANVLGEASQNILGSEGIFVT